MTPNRDSLAALTDAIEATGYEGMFAAMPRSVSEELGARIEKRAGATALLMSRVPAAVFNRVIGLGVHQPATERDVDAIVNVYRAAGVRRSWVHVWEGARSSELREGLVARGFTVARLATWAKMIRGTEPPPEVRSDLQIGALEAGREAEIGEVLVSAHGLPPSTAPWLASLATYPGWSAYAAKNQRGKIVGGGFLMLDGERAWLGAGGTLPEYRGRGVQGSIMAMRIRVAIAAGCTHIATETGEPAPGEKTSTNPSLSNMYRMGFERVASRTNYEIDLG